MLISYIVSYLKGRFMQGKEKKKIKRGEKGGIILHTVNFWIHQ